MQTLRELIRRLFTKQPQRIALTREQVHGIIIQARMKRTNELYEFTEKEILFYTGFKEETK